MRSGRSGCERGLAVWSGRAPAFATGCHGACEGCKDANGREGVDGVVGMACVMVLCVRISCGAAADHLSPQGVQCAKALTAA